MFFDDDDFLKKMEKSHRDLRVGALAVFIMFILFWGGVAFLAYHFLSKVW